MYSKNHIEIANIEEIVINVYIINSTVYAVNTGLKLNISSFTSCY